MRNVLNVFSWLLLNCTSNPVSNASVYVHNIIFVYFYIVPDSLQAFLNAVSEQAMSIFIKRRVKMCSPSGSVWEQGKGFIWNPKWYNNNALKKSFGSRTESAAAGNVRDDSLFLPHPMGWRRACASDVIEWAGLHCPIFRTSPFMVTNS